MKTKQIINLLSKAGINTDSLTISNSEVEVFVPSAANPNHADYDKTRRLVRKVSKVLGFGGFSCAHGGWVLSPDTIDRGDWNNRSSLHHY